MTEIMVVTVLKDERKLHCFGIAFISYHIPSWFTNDTFGGSEFLFAPCVFFLCIVMHFPMAFHCITCVIVQFIS